MEILPLILIPTLYILIALTKPYIQKKIPFNICAICVAVSFTWLSLLILWLVNFNVPEVEVAILMGMSLTGIMYKLEKVFEKHQITNFWFVRLVIIVGGFYLVYFILEREMSMMILLAVLILILSIIPTFFFQEKRKSPEKKSSIYKKLDNCC